MKKGFIVLTFVVMVLCSCGTQNKITRESQYQAMYEAKPVTLLVMPPINNTSYVEAKDLLYTSICKPLAEAGYYVISPFLAMDVLRAESAYDSENFTNASLLPFKNVFGADAVIFSEILDWTKAGFGIHTNIRYYIKMVQTGEIVFDRTCDLYLDLSNLSSSANQSWIGLLIDVATSAIETALTQHIEAARLANDYIFSDIPYGKYHPEYERDMEYPASERDLKTTVK